MADQVVVALAREQPADMQELAGIEGMTDGLLKHRGKELLSVISDKNIDDSGAEPPKNIRPDAREKTLSKQLTKILDNVAGQLNIPASLLATRRDLMAMVQGERTLNVLQGWRREVVGDNLLEQLEKSA
jgi:ribonuclease D